MGYYQEMYTFFLWLVSHNHCQWQTSIYDGAFDIQSIVILYVNRNKTQSVTFYRHMCIFQEVFASTHNGFGLRDIIPPLNSTDFYLCLQLACDSLCTGARCVSVCVRARARASVCVCVFLLYAFCSLTPVLFNAMICSTMFVKKQL